MRPSPRSPWGSSCSRSRSGGSRPRSSRSRAVAVAAAFFVAYPDDRPVDELHATRSSSSCARTRSKEPGASADPFSPGESSLASHWRNLRDGIEAVVEHPQGYGLGNAGVVAKRTGVEIKAGESTFVELGTDAGVAGLVAFVLWSLAVLVGLLRREAWVGAAFAAVLLLGLQTDVIGVHWLAVVVWALAGLGPGRDRASPRPSPPPECRELLLSPGPVPERVRFARALPYPFVSW